MSCHLKHESGLFYKDESTGARYFHSFELARRYLLDRAEAQKMFFLKKLDMVKDDIVKLNTMKGTDKRTVPGAKQK